MSCPFKRTQGLCEGPRGQREGQQETSTPDRNCLGETPPFKNVVKSVRESSLYWGLISVRGLWILRQWGQA